MLLVLPCTQVLLRDPSLERRGIDAEDAGTLSGVDLAGAYAFAIEAGKAAGAGGGRRLGELRGVGVEVARKAPWR